MFLILSRHGVRARRAAYIGDFMFDVVVDTPDQKEPAAVMEVLSFARTVRDWAPVENDAAHLEASATGVIRPPADASHENAQVAYERVTRWFKETNVPIVAPDQVEDLLPTRQPVLFRSE